MLASAVIFLVGWRLGAAMEIQKVEDGVTMIGTNSSDGLAFMYADIWRT